MAQTKHYDLIVIGSGPGGYVGAIRAAQLGLKTAVVERNNLGGVCLNWGCIPTKALLHNAELYQEAITHGKEWGIMVDPDSVEVDFQKVIGRSRAITGGLNSGVGYLLKKNKIDHYDGHAKITSGRTAGGPCSIEISEASGDYYNGAGGKTTGKLTADNIMVATGARPNQLPFAPCDGTTILSSYDALEIPELPKSMVIVGSGAIGMEFAYFFNAFGTKVTVVEMLERILPAEDDDVSKIAQKSFTKQGITFKTAHTVKGIKTGKTGAKVDIAPADGSGKAESIECEKVLVAIGVHGRFDGLFEESLGLKIEKGHIATDFQLPRTDVPDLGQGDLRNRRRDRPPLAGPREFGRSGRLCRTHRRPPRDSNRLQLDSRLHLLLAADRLDRAHRTGLQGTGTRVRHRRLSAQGPWQGDRGRQDRGHGQDHHQQALRRDPRCTHHRRGCQ
jgi:dihydrolipoamide dehydrogenase